MLLEASDRAGGLATSYVDGKGFTWDIGGHVQFSHYDYFDEAMVEFLGADGWLHHERESWVWMRERFIPYPFQNNIRRPACGRSRKVPAGVGRDHPLAASAAGKFPRVDRRVLRRRHR